MSCPLYSALVPADLSVNNATVTDILVACRTRTRELKANTIQSTYVTTEFLMADEITPPILDIDVMTLPPVTGDGTVSDPLDLPVTSLIPLMQWGTQGSGDDFNGGGDGVWLQVGLSSAVLPGGGPPDEETQIFIAPRDLTQLIFRLQKVDVTNSGLFSIRPYNTSGTVMFGGTATPLDISTQPAFGAAIWTFSPVLPAGTRFILNGFTTVTPPPPATQLKGNIYAL